jgi:hypothetical protein
MSTLREALWGGIDTSISASCMTGHIEPSMTLPQPAAVAAGLPPLA